MKVILTESQFRKITESAENLDSPLYHYTFLSFLIGMLETGTFETSNCDFDYYNAKKYGYSYYCDRNRDYISFTRDKMYNVNMDKVLGGSNEYLGPQVRIQFNPNFVKNIRNGRLQPYYFDGYPDQKEERLYFEKNTKSIPLDTKYIDRIDIVTNFLKKDDVPLLDDLFKFPEIINKTYIYYIKYALNQYSIDRSNGETIKDDKYKLYLDFLKGNEKSSVPLISLKNVLHYFNDNELSNYKVPSYMEQYYNGDLKDENEQWLLNKKRKQYTDLIISCYNKANDEQKKQIVKLYNEYKDKLSEPFFYDLRDARGFKNGTYKDDIYYLNTLCDKIDFMVNGTL